MPGDPGPGTQNLPAPRHQRGFDRLSPNGGDAQPERWGAWGL